MNKKQRKALADLLEQLDGLATELQKMGEEEDEKAENLPENLRYSAKGDELDENSSALCDAASDIQDIICGLQEHFEL